LTGSGKTSIDSVTLPGIKVRSTVTTLATGTMGCSSVSNITGLACPGANFGTLTETAGAVTKLAVTSVPASATAATNFSVTVKSTDAYGNPQNVVAITTFQLNPSGTGTISNNTGQISAGANTATLSTVQYTKADSLTLI